MRVVKKKYEGRILRFKNSQVSIGVTPDHRMLISQKEPNKNSSRDRKLKFVKAKEVSKTSHTIPNVGIFKGEEREFFTLRGCERGDWKTEGYKKRSSCREIKDINISMDLWLRFLGAFISDGYCYRRKGVDRRRGQVRREYTVSVLQSKHKEKFGQVMKEIAQCLRQQSYYYRGLQSTAHPPP